MPVKRSEFDHEMTRLETEIKRLEAEYNMFFAGRLPRLPWETRARVEKLVKRYDRMHLRNTAERFRFGTVQARYVKFCELWERNLRSKEEGRPLPGKRGAAMRAAPKHPAPAEIDDQVADAPRVVHEAAIRDPTRDDERMKDLYEQLSRARKEAGEQPLPFNRFAAVIKAQVSKLGKGDADVAFQVTVKDGKVTLAAKPVKS
jgi:hypothetical protein